MDGPAFTNSVSMIFNKVYQEQQLKSLQKRLLSDQNNVLATILSERLKSSFGLRALPSLDDALPFIHFDDAGQTHFTLIYTSSLLSPFALISSHYFGRHIINLQREVYHTLYTNTLNISDSEEEMPNEQPPPALSYANGKTRDRLYANEGTCGSNVSKGAEETAREDSKEENSSESLQSYSLSSLLSPALRCSSIALADAAKQPAHDSSESTPDAAEQSSQERTTGCNSASAVATGNRVQLNKKYKCDRCAKSFSVRSHLDSHKVTHTGEKKYECKRCGNRFTQSSSLRNHMIAIHTRQFPHVCGQCNKGFLLPSQLRKHKDNSHSKFK